MENTQLLSEILRPRSISDMALPPDISCSLERMEVAGSLINLLFYGGPGIGKTSAARILIENADVLEINGSFNNGDKAILRLIENFASTMSLFSKPKVCFIDEADYLTKEVQAGLRHIIEKFSATTRFILTANEIDKVTSAIRSRCTPICFDIAPMDRAIIIDQKLARYEKRLTELGYEYDLAELRETVGIYFPDWRSIANQLQLSLGK